MERLTAAAGIFEQARVALSRSPLTLGAGSARPTSLDSRLPEMVAAFQSLAEVLESLGGIPLPDGAPEAEPRRLLPPREGVRRR